MGQKWLGVVLHQEEEARKGPKQVAFEVSSEWEGASLSKI